MDRLTKLLGGKQKPAGSWDAVGERSRAYATGLALLGLAAADAFER